MQATSEGCRSLEGRATSVALPDQGQLCYTAASSDAAAADSRQRCNAANGPVADAGHRQGGAPGVEGLHDFGVPPAAMWAMSAASNQRLCVVQSQQLQAVCSPCFVGALPCLLQDEGLLETWTNTTDPCLTPWRGVNCTCTASSPFLQCDETPSNRAQRVLQVGIRTRPASAPAPSETRCGSCCRHALGCSARVQCCLFGFSGRA